jgi:transcriptional regulator with XRE-family HTH domain
VDDRAFGQQLRTLRTAAGRTVASVAADAGLSVPYIANLENGRGNPTVTVLTRLAAALGTRLTITIEPATTPDHLPVTPAQPTTPRIPPSLVRLGRTRRFQQAVRAMAARLDRDPDEFSPQLVAALAAMAQPLDKNLTEPEWWRLLDALLLIAAFPDGEQA